MKTRFGLGAHKRGMCRSAAKSEGTIRKFYIASLPREWSPCYRDYVDSVGRYKS